MEYPPFFGGVGNYYFNLVNNLSFKTKVLADKKNLNDKQPLTDVTYIDLLNKRGPIKWFKIVGILRQLSKKPDKKIVWVGNLLPIGSACLIAKKLFGLDYFVSLHGLDWQCANISFRKKYIADKILKSALFITANSYSTANLLPEKFRNKTQVVYPAASINNAKPDLSVLKKNNLQPQEYFLSVGRLVSRKGQKQTIEAWAKINQTHPQFKLVIAGKGELQKELNDLIIELNLNEKVIMLSNASNEEVSGLYQNAFCFIFPVQPLVNNNEGFGIVCLEAQQFGLPVITTKIGGVTEAVNDSALLLEKATPDEISLAVKQLIENNELRHNLINKSIANVKNFSWQNSATLLNNLIAKYD